MTTRRITKEVNVQVNKDFGKSATEIISERGKTHGNFLDNASVSQQIKASLRQGPNYAVLTVTQLEALDMIAHKMARIVSGNANEPDHWRDIGGYAALECNILEGK